MAQLPLNCIDQEYRITAAFKEMHKLILSGTNKFTALHKASLQWMVTAISLEKEYNFRAELSLMFPD